MPASLRPRTRRRALFALTILAVVLASGEGATRLLGADLVREARNPAPTVLEGSPEMAGNPYLLWEMTPGTRHDLGVVAQVNQLGMRGPDPDPEPPPGVHRVLALGDSSIFGFGVGDDEVFTAVLDAALGDGVDVLNGAALGYSTFQTINLLELRGLALDPDVLLVGCLWSDNNFDAFVDRDLIAAYSSFGSRGVRRARQILGHSALFRVLDYRYRVLRKAPDYRTAGWMVGQGEHTGTRRVAIDDYARNLETIVSLAHDHDAEVAFILLANQEDLDATEPGRAAWEPYREVMRDTATRHGAPLLDVPQLFRESGLAASDLFLDVMHPSALGHRLVADGVASLFQERGWPPGPLERDPVPGPLPAYEDPFVHGRAGDGEVAGAPVAVGPASPGVAISGDLVVPQYTRGMIQVDVVEAEGDRPAILGNARFPGPGPFAMSLPVAGRAVRFVAYLDEDADGPGPGDTRIELPGDPLLVPEGGVEDLRLDLATGRSVRMFAEGGPATP